MPSVAGFDPFVVPFALAGGVWGVIADRIAARWPAHEDGSIRRVDWRTIVMVAVAAAALAGAAQRFSEPVERALFVAYFAALVLLMATDLDQRLMPDLITLPIIPLAAAVGLTGANSLVAHDLALALAGAVIVPGVLYALSLPFGEGAFGLGDVKFLVGLGLVVGLVRSVVAVFAGALLSGVVIAALLVTRRITLKSYIPFGPFLIGGALWVIVISTSH